MTDFLPREVQDELDAARRMRLRKKSRLRIVDADGSYPILRLLAEGFTLDATDVGHLRGLVDVYDGSRHLSQCLIVASDIQGGELICRMKWSTTARQTPALDYERNDEAPRGYLPRR